eukprot:GHRR01021538.1.p1 GENE.GHRR01021538.1~~GHRR01021538.1.p1  ORF type:complete len:132 (+),score=16.98 GHRR01021538.1:147-542(+)
MSAPKVYGPTGKIEPFLDYSITRHFLSTIPDQSGKIIAEYVWIGGTGQDLRSKARTLAKKPEKPEDLPHWNYDGSSTGQAPGTDSEVYLIPRAIFRYTKYTVTAGYATVSDGRWDPMGAVGSCSLLRTVSS